MTQRNGGTHFQRDSEVWTFGKRPSHRLHLVSRNVTTYEVFSGQIDLRKPNWEEGSSSGAVDHDGARHASIC